MLPYVREPALWPVALAVLGHVVVVLAPLMLAVHRVGSWLAAAALGGIAALTLVPVVHEVRVHGRPGAVFVALALTWVVSVAAAVGAGSAGLI